jgi:hypothetical protein
MRRTSLPLIALLAATPASVRADDLALRRVMLSTGGVGYFEYAAEVDGPATLGLDVPLSQVDDVLASLVVFDSAGSVGAAELPGRDGTRAAFAGVPLGPAALRSALDYLNSLQGTMFTVAGPRAMSGRLLRAEAVNEPAPPPAHSVARTRVTLLTDAGLQQFVLEDADSVQVADPALRAGVARLLEALRAEPAQAARHISLHGGGVGHRTLRVGYVAGAPLWKTSYRLILPEHAGSPARLQGWAVLENESGSDWKDVDLTLQYGNPVTFRQALYRAYYVQRPEAPVEVLGRILPGVDTGVVAKSFAADAAPAAPAPAMQPAMRAATLAQAAMAEPETATAVSEAAEATLFHLVAPLSLLAGHTATVPILDRPAPAERVGVVREGRPHPLQALDLRNDTGSSLPAGMLTFYDTADAAAFAGDARLGGLPAGQSRLLEFAEDLRTNVDWRSDSGVSLLGVTAAKGVLTVRQRERWTARIALAAPTSEPRQLLLEIQRRPDGTLAPDSGLQPAGETATAWRLAVSLRPGESRTVTVHVDRVLREQTSLLDDSDVLAAVLGEQSLAEPARTALRHIATLRATLADREAERDRLRGQIANIEKDEDRLRKNLSAISAGDALRNRLTRALEADEDRIATLSDAAAKADAAATQAREALASAVQTLQL